MTQTNTQIQNVLEQVVETFIQNEAESQIQSRANLDKHTHRIVLGGTVRGYIGPINDVGQALIGEAYVPFNENVVYSRVVGEYNKRMTTSQLGGRVK